MVLALLFLIPKETGTVKVGVLTPISGPAAFYGESIVNGIDCAKQLVNENGGINGRRIELVVEDSKCDGATAVTAAQKLINVDGVSGIVGEVCSAAVISMGSIAENSKVVVIASAASNPKVTENPYLFRVNPNDLAQSEAIAGYIKENFGLKKSEFLLKMMNMELD